MTEPWKETIASTLRADYIPRMTEHHAFPKCKICDGYHAGVEHVWGGTKSVRRDSSTSEPREDAGSTPAPGTKSTAPRMDVGARSERGDTGTTRQSAQAEPERAAQAGTQVQPVDTTPKRGRPKTILDMKAYKADKERERRRKKAAAK